MLTNRWRRVLLTITTRVVAMCVMLSTVIAATQHGAVESAELLPPNLLDAQVAPANCVPGSYHVQSTHNFQDAGVYGHNQAREVTTASGSYQVRSIWVWRDDLNWVELGWWTSSQSPRPQYFAAWKVNGTYSEWLGLYAPLGYHTYTLQAPLNDGYWYFYVDGNLMYTVKLPFDVGFPGAQSEAHNTCDQNGTTWKELKYFIRSYSLWLYWTGNQTVIDTNPNYYFCPISNWEFKVLPNSVSCPP